MHNSGDGNIQEGNSKNSGLIKKALTFGRYTSLGICALSGGSGYAAGADVEILVNQALDYFDYPPVPEGSIKYSFGATACIAFSAFNMASSQKFWDDFSKLITEHLRKHGCCSPNNALRITAFIAILVLGFGAAGSSAVFTYEAIKSTATALVVALTNEFGTALADREGLDWALTGIFNAIKGCCSKGAQTAVTAKGKVCSMIGSSPLFLLSVTGAVAGLAGITGNPMVAANSTGMRLLLLASGFGPVTVFAASSYNGFRDLLRKSNAPEAREATQLLNTTAQHLSQQQSRGRRVVVPVAVCIPSLVAAICLTASTGALFLTLFGKGSWQTVLIIITLILGTLVLFVAFEKKACSITDMLIGEGWKLIEKCCSRQKTGENSPLIPNSDGRIEEV